jgi:hypothetical protein
MDWVPPPRTRGNSGKEVVRRKAAGGKGEGSWNMDMNMSRKARCHSQVLRTPGSDK